MNLYWVTTDDHAEDWFIVASSAQEAATFHEDAEGYDYGDATAEMIVEIPKGIDASTGWPSDEVLKSCGAKFLSKAPARVVEIGDLRFCEGLMESTIRAQDDDRFEAIGQGRPNKTEKATVH
jgi:uncharacterized protein CbrC (UPF0167 family)